MEDRTRPPPGWYVTQAAEECEGGWQCLPESGGKGFWGGSLEKAVTAAWLWYDKAEPRARRSPRARRNCVPRPERTTTLPADSAARKEIPLFRGPLRYFPAALAGVARVCKIGNDKHNPGEEMHHARGKSTDHADCILRHLMDLSEDFGRGVGYDENGEPQVNMIAWRAMALAQEWHETRGAPLAPGARLPEKK